MRLSDHFAGALRSPAPRSARREYPNAVPGSRADGRGLRVAAACVWRDEWIDSDGVGHRRARDAVAASRPGFRPHLRRGVVDMGARS